MKITLQHLKKKKLLGCVLLFRIQFHGLKFSGVTFTFTFITHCLLMSTNNLAADTFSP